jgi:protein-S-isoprenylcysteine O-methyltransferase Ste14
VKISRYKKLFGVGPLGALITTLLLGALWLVDMGFRHLRILDDPTPIWLAGFALLAIWLCWHGWCIRIISRWWRHDRLCTDGPYRFVRHPIYAGGALLAATGISLMFNSWIVLLLPFLSFAVNSNLVREEESMMESVFGEEYRCYAARTGRLFPKIGYLMRLGRPRR